MSRHSLHFLTDENIATPVVHALRKAGHDVFDVKEEKLYGSSDAKLIAIAEKSKRIIVTHDSDFLLQSNVSIILLRFHDQRPEKASRSLLDFLSSTLIRKLKEGATVILTGSSAEFYP